MSVVCLSVCRLSVVCKHFLVSTITRLNLIRSWWNFTWLLLGAWGWTLLNFCYDDVISGDIALWACEHDNLTIFHPISTKLGMVDGIWVQTNPIEKRLFIYFVFQQLHCRGVAPPSAALVKIWWHLHYAARILKYILQKCVTLYYIRPQ